MKDWSELSDQTRAVIAAALALVVILGWGLLYKPPPPTPSATPSSQTTALSTGTPNARTAAPASAQQLVAASASSNTAAPTNAAAVSASAEQDVTIESDLYHVVLSNRGAVARSWQLTKYTDKHEPPRTLDLVQSDASQAAGGWPFSLQVSDPQIEAAANQGLYVVTQDGAPVSGGILKAPAEVEFRWSDGQTEVTKQWKFDSSYIVQFQTSVRRNGQAVAHRVAWRGGFGDATAFRAAIQTLAFSGSAGNLAAITTKKLGASGQPSVPADQPGALDAAGVEDLYFAAAFLPPDTAPGQPVPADLTLSGWQLTRSVTGTDSKTQQEILPEVAVGVAATAPGPETFRVFVGPKDLDTLKAVRPPLNGLVQFGWFGFIAEPLFYSLRWLHHYIPNYGWAIVIMTLAINMVLYPLKVKSWRSMQRMQKVAPEIKQIQDRYKKYSMRDPRKQEMNKEVMAVYSREGVNPMGSCLPTVVQMPIWFGLYRMLTVTMELRHAPWILWIHDLSGPDPYYILPVIMAILMYAVTKMTPQTITDPSQQRMMALMPIMFGGMFVIFPVSSGLVLYILTSNVVAVVQQWHLNRTSPLKPPKLKKQQRAALDSKTVTTA